MDDLMEGSTKKTKLQKFCDKVSLDKIEELYGSKQSKNYLVVAIALTIMHAANKMLRKVQGHEILSGYLEGTDPDIIIFESAAYIYVNFSFSFIKSNLYLDDESERLDDAIYSAFTVIAGFFKKHTSFTDCYGKIAKRGYGTEKNGPTPRFIQILLQSKDQSEPLAEVRTNKESLDEPLNFGIGGLKFPEVILQETSESLFRLLRNHVNTPNQ